MRILFNIRGLIKNKRVSVAGLWRDSAGATSVYTFTGRYKTLITVLGSQPKAGMFKSFSSCNGLVV
jgi:hypothetical protein